ncbi:hypothetical protein ACFLZH_05485 [Patescibacteria group bacterium]
MVKNLTLGGENKEIFLEDLSQEDLTPPLKEHVFLASNILTDPDIQFNNPLQKSKSFVLSLVDKLKAGAVSWGQAAKEIREFNETYNQKHGENKFWEGVGMRGEFEITMEYFNYTVKLLITSDGHVYQDVDLQTSVPQDSSGETTPVNVDELSRQIIGLEFGRSDVIARLLEELIYAGKITFEQAEEIVDQYNENLGEDGDENPNFESVPIHAARISRGLVCRVNETLGKIASEGNTKFTIQATCDENGKITLEQKWIPDEQ